MKTEDAYFRAFGAPATSCSYDAGTHSSSRVFPVSHDRVGNRHSPLNGLASTSSLDELLRTISMFRPATPTQSIPMVRPDVVLPLRIRHVSAYIFMDVDQGATTSHSSPLALPR
jgi:hypothetical protein